MAPRSRSELFLVDPNVFVALRNDLARELRARGDKEGATEIKQLRRPSVAVWALNQVAHEHADLAQRLVETARDAEAAQRALLEGNPADDFRAVVTSRRDALSAVGAAAADVIGRSGRSPDASARDVDNALDAIVATSEALDTFARAELDTIAEPTGETEMFAGITLAASATTRSVPPKPERDRMLRAVPAEPAPVERPPSARLVKAREQLDVHRAEVNQVESSLRTAAAAVSEADELLEVAQREQRRTAAERDRIRMQLDRARERVARSEELVARYES